ncbi:MAG: TonB-dependent receptor [bacterium]
MRSKWVGWLVACGCATPAAMSWAQETPEAEAPAADAPAADAPAAEAPAAAADAPVETIVVVGSQSGSSRTAMESPVAIDVIDVGAALRQYGQAEVNAVLQVSAPSFNATRQSGADGADHIDPASLRGLGPDQTLVLVNGKRRHPSSLINIFGSRGRGNTGTDLNAIPAAAIARVEVLRDGASALYGSDAIAGVINIVLKDTADRHDFGVLGGVRDASPPDEYDVLREDTVDGFTWQYSSNHGFRLGDEGFVNLTFDWLHKDHTNRPADPAKFDIYRRQYGDAMIDNLGTMLNAELPVGDGAIYLFGGYNLRLSDAFAWTRGPDDERNVAALYPGGFDPHITSTIHDVSATGGWRTRLGGWGLDLSNGFGWNRFTYGVEGTLNASLGAESPTVFDAGGHELMQNNTRLVVTRPFAVDWLSAVNVGVGGEVRWERYGIFAGEEGSWRNYALVDGMAPEGAPPGGAQGFPGFRPENEVDASRVNVGGFADVEVDVTEWWMLGLTGRAEHYSDFGGTLDGKVATRLSLADLLGLDLDQLALRGSFSTGFRAPSLAQLHYNTTFTDFVGGTPIDKVIVANTDPLARAVGIPALREEKAQSASVGLAGALGTLSASVDGYVIDIADRVVLTGAFEDTDAIIGEALRAQQVGAAQFFTNALDTRTYGLDVVLSWADVFAGHRVGLGVAANWNHMELGDVKTSARLAGKEEIYFGPRERAFLLASAPESKVAVSADYGIGVLGVHARVVRFGEVTLVDWLDTEDVYAPAWVLDVSVDAEVYDGVVVVVGAENVFDAYPTQQDTETETGGLWDAVQMGTSGAFYFGRVRLSL